MTVMNKKNILLSAVCIVITTCFINPFEINAPQEDETVMPVVHPENRITVVEPAMHALVDPHGNEFDQDATQPALVGEADGAAIDFSTEYSQSLPEA